MKFKITRIENKINANALNLNKITYTSMLKYIEYDKETINYL